MLLVVVVTALFIITRRDTADEAYDEEEAAREQVERERLLLAVVNLDEAHESGDMELESYQQQRQKLLARIGGHLAPCLISISISNPGDNYDLQAHNPLPPG
ncbi:MAG: hypothetical protein M5U34_41985 [Chloroflexi bacterium]|nr:hypothetical protein [Chloroflexota bacterium]